MKIKFSTLITIVVTALVSGIIIGVLMDLVNGEIQYLEVPVEVPIEVVKEIHTEVQVPVEVEKIVYLDGSFPPKDFGINVFTLNKHIQIGGYNVYDYFSTVTGVICETLVDPIVYSNQTYVWRARANGCNEIDDYSVLFYIEVENNLVSIENAVNEGIITTSDLDDAGIFDKSLK